MRSRVIESSSEWGQYDISQNHSAEWEDVWRELVEHPNAAFDIYIFLGLDLNIHVNFTQSVFFAQ